MRLCSYSLCTHRCHLKINYQKQNFWSKCKNMFIFRYVLQKLYPIHSQPQPSEMFRYTCLPAMYEETQFPELLLLYDTTIQYYKITLFFHLFLCQINSAVDLNLTLNFTSVVPSEVKWFNRLIGQLQFFFHKLSVSDACSVFSFKLIFFLLIYDNGFLKSVCKII